MATEKRFEARFEGPANKGLRAMIRRAVRSEDSCPARAAAVRAVADRVALTALGKATLEQVARDYDPVDYDPSPYPASRESLKLRAGGSKMEPKIITDSAVGPVIHYTTDEPDENLDAAAAAEGYRVDWETDSVQTNLVDDGEPVWSLPLIPIPRGWMTPDEAWEAYVGDQGRQEFVDCCDDVPIEEAVSEYVGNCETCTDLTDADRDRLTELLLAHIRADMPDVR